MLVGVKVCKKTEPYLSGKSRQAAVARVIPRWISKSPVGFSEKNGTEY